MVKNPRTNSLTILLVTYNIAQAARVSDYTAFIHLLDDSGLYLA